MGPGPSQRYDSRVAGGGRKHTTCCAPAIPQSGDGSGGRNCTAKDRFSKGGDKKEAP